MSLERKSEVVRRIDEIRKNKNKGIGQAKNYSATKTNE